MQGNYKKRKNCIKIFNGKMENKVKNSTSV